VRRLLFIIIAICLAAPIAGTGLAEAHPAPFSYLDVRLDDNGITGTLVLHVVDVAHELGMTAPESLQEAQAAEAAFPNIAAFLRDRLSFAADGRALTVAWDGIAPAPERHAVQLRFHLTASPASGESSGPTAAATAAATESARSVGYRPGGLSMRALLFPYDGIHQTFVNVYEDGELRYQGIFARANTERVYYAGTVRGALAVAATFVPSGVHHILIGPDHILFLIGLLLLGARPWALLRIVTAFTIGHSLTLSLAALDLLTPPSRVVEPAIALSIVFVGADNLLVRREGGRDLRLWIALVFGFVHGFGFASVLKEFGLPREALGWSLFFFNVGVEIGQLVIVGIVASLLALIRGRNPVLGQRLVVAGSIVVIAAGTYWFIERVFFTGGA
jgi:hydrogenase/urease accessory protein HupE